MKLLTACFLAAIFALTAMATETPDYKVLSQDGKFEVREYPGLTLVRTASGDGDFMRLFRYISGGRRESSDGWARRGNFAVRGIERNEGEPRHARAP